MKSFLTSFLTLLTIVIAVAFVVTFTGITPGFHGNLATAQTTTAAPPAAVTPTPSPTGNIIQTMTANGQFTQSLALIQAAGLTQTLESAGPYTVFAPTDTAISQVPAAQFQVVVSNPNQLKQVLSYHVVPGELTVAQLQGKSQVTTLEGAPLTVSSSGGVVHVGNAKIVQGDIFATNGVIHGIDQVLQLPAAGATPTPTPTKSPASAGTSGGTSTGY